MVLFRAKQDATLEPWELLSHQLYRWKNIQSFICLVNVITAAFLAGYIGSRDLGLQGGLPAFVTLAGVTFTFTTLSNWFGRYLGGFVKRGCIGLFITFDLACVGTMIGSIAVLSVAHLPWNCKGLTSDVSGARDPKPGYSTLGFGDGDSKGELDDFCPITRMNWVFSLILLISYIHTTSWSIRLIAALSHRTKTLKSDPETPHEPKVLDSPASTSPATQHAQIVSPPAPVALPPAHTEARVMEHRGAIPMEPRREGVLVPGDNAGAALISDGSWSSAGPTPAASPPAYAESEGKVSVGHV